tara:strand:+ start:10478 stop:11065 length:588 start_codon:yes stop_codon:yes gene_type:complete
MNKLALIGNDIDLVDQIILDKRIQLCGIIDKKTVENQMGVSYLGKDKDFKDINFSFLCSLDDGRKKKDIIERFYGSLNFINFRSEFSYISKFTKIGYGNIFQRNTISMANVIIGNHCKINIGATIHHDSKLGNYVTICPGSRLLGNVKIGNCVYVGSGALILPGIEIGDNSIIGAGAVVTENLKKNSNVKGVPAK